MFQYQDEDKLLFLGEGNFSFSANFLQLHHSKYLAGQPAEKQFVNVYASCFQSEDVDATAERTINIQALKKLGVNVLFDVDATKVHQHHKLKDIKFDKIVFMFPHVGGKMKIHLNRQLLSGIFESSHYILASEGKLLITLCAGQGGTPFENEVRRKDDTWKILDLSLDQGFVLTDVYEFPTECYSKYCQVGYRSLQKRFHVEGSVVHVFKLGPPLCFQPINKCDIIDDSFEVKHTDQQKIVQLYPTSHMHHLSFWCSEKDTVLSVEQLEKVSKYCLGQVVRNIEIIDVYSSQEGRTSQTIQLEYKSEIFPLGPKRSIELHKVFGQSLVNIFNVELR